MKVSLAIIAVCAMLGPVSARGQTWSDDNWPTYGKDLNHTFSNPHSEINPRNVSTLAPAWTFPTEDAVTASPAVVDGVVYVGSWDGYFYALDAASGRLKWRVQLDCQPSVVPVPQICGGPAPGTPDPNRFRTPGGIVTSSAAVVGDRVFFGGGRALYSLAAEDGRIIWKHVICGNPDDRDCILDQKDPLQILSSPAVENGKIFVGVSTGGVEFGIPYRGGFVALDAQSGNQIWRFEVDPTLDAQMQTIGGQNRGCGNVWSSPAVDSKQHLVVFGTSDCEEQPQPPYHGSVLALDTETGRLRWVFRPREVDPNKCDFDFGASPNLIETNEHEAVGIGGKDGTYYLLDRASGQQIWSTRVVFGGEIGGFFGGAAFDGRRIFSATAFGDGNVQSQSGLCAPGYQDPENPNVVDTFVQDPSLHSIAAKTGQILNEAQKSQSFGPTTLGDRIIFSGFTGLSETDLPAVKTYRASSLGLLLTLPSAVGGRPGSVNSAVIPVGRAIFFGSGNFFDGTGGGVHAYALSNPE
ncbi:MAG: PQQ-binding-like beta-propeller repeat protein [Rhodopila sp.]